MKIIQVASLSETLYSRREAIAQRWYDAVVRTSFVPFTEHDFLSSLLALTDQTIATFLAEPFAPQPARDIGTALAQLHCIAPEALGGTQEILATHLLADLPAETVSDLQPRLAGLLSGLAIGFLRQSRKILLAEQEVIRQALLVQRLRAEESLRESEARFRTIFEGAAIAIVLVGTDGRIIESNPAMETMLGYSKDELHGQPFLAFVYQEDTSAAWGQFESVAVGIEGRHDLEIRFYRKDGRVVWGHVIVSFVRDVEGRPQFAIGMGEDITERRRAEESLRKSEARYRAVLDTAIDAIITVTTDGQIQSFNRGAERIFGYASAEIVDRSLALILPIQHRDVCQAAAHDGHGNDPGEYPGWRARECAGLRKNGEEIPLEVSVSVVRNGDDILITSILRDITERKSLEEQLAFQAYHDSLTGLPNRALFTDRIERSVDRAPGQQGGVAILFLDLDDFKLVNDSLGHKVGDGLLISVARRLQQCMTTGEMVARFGGDEFTILVQNVGSVTEITDLADRIADQFKVPFDLGEHEIRITASIGIAFGRSGRCESDELLRNADIAMYEAKRTGKARRVVFNWSINAAVLQRVELEHDLWRAIERQEFLLHYQPIISLETGRAEGIEALIHWDHPERGLIPPESFIPLAEETGLIFPIGQWVLREACRQAKIWDDRWAGYTPPSLSVNVSMRQLQQKNFVEELRAILRETGLAPSSLVLELTENTVIKDSQSAHALLTKLKALGVQLAIDDFGTVHSSLFYLIGRYPVDFVKIDRSFIEHVGENRDGTFVLAGIIDLCHAAGMKVIAEGIETARQFAELRGMGADFGQGYYFAKPLVARELGGIAAGGLKHERR